MNVQRVAEALRLLAAAVEAEGALLAPAPAVEGPCAWVPIRKCGLPERTARRLVKARVIAGSRIGRDVFVLRADVDRYCESQRIDAQGDEGDGDEVSRAIARKNLRLVGGRR